MEASKIDDDIREAWYSFLIFCWGGGEVDVFMSMTDFFLLRDGS